MKVNRISAAAFNAAFSKVGVSRRPAPRKYEQREAALQRAVIEHFRIYGSKGWLVWSTPNAGKRDPRLGAELKRQGMTAGVGDLSLLGGGRYHELELKDDRRWPTDEQSARGAAVIAAGGRWAVARSLDEAIAVLRRWGALRMAGGRGHADDQRAAGVDRADAAAGDAAARSP